MDIGLSKDKYTVNTTYNNSVEISEIFLSFLILGKIHVLLKSKIPFFGRNGVWLLLVNFYGETKPQTKIGLRAAKKSI